jgi:hypothetical protein
MIVPLTALGKFLSEIDALDLAAGLRPRPLANLDVVQAPPRKGIGGSCTAP